MSIWLMVVLVVGWYFGLTLLPYHWQQSLLAWLPVSWRQVLLGWGQVWFGLYCAVLLLVLVLANYRGYALFNLANQHASAVKSANHYHK